MEHQKSITMLENTSNEFRPKNWVEIKVDDAGGTYNRNSQIKSKTIILKSSLRDYSDAYVLVKGTITIAGAEAATQTSKHFIFKKCVWFTDCMSKINNTKVVNAKDLNAVMLMYSLSEYNDNYSKISRGLF